MKTFSKVIWCVMKMNKNFISKLDLILRPCFGHSYILSYDKNKWQECIQQVGCQITIISID